MKKIIYRFLFAFLAICLFGNTSLLAQSANDEKTVKITIVTKDDQVIVKKKRIKNGEVPTDFEEFKDLDSDNIKTIDVEIVENSTSKKEGKSTKKCDPRTCKPTKDCMPDDNSFFFYRNGSNSVVEIEDEELIEIRNRMRSNRRNWNMNFGGDPKPLLGVYASDEKVEKGVKLSGIIQGKGAAAAGLQKGDIITKVDGNKVNHPDDIGRVIREMKPGEVVKVNFLRNGKKMSERVELSAGKSRFRNRYKVERDPCKVFIGVETNETPDEGVKVSKIIEDTPAYDMDLRRGDIILKFDKVPVNSQPELLRERNLNQPGDYFKMTILRDGKKKTVKGQFKACEDDKPEIEPIPEIEQEDGTGLNVRGFQAFPNPTFGEINIEFEGAEVPTVVRVTDVSGKVVFEDKIRNFNGSYKRRVVIQNGRPGNMSVSVIQNNKATTKNVILLNKA